MEKIISKFIYTLAAVFAVVLFIFSSLCGGVGRVYAATTVNGEYEQSNVLDDLEGSVIGGNSFDISDYPFDENGKPQIISFVEFCYSFYSEKQDNYALYVYVYNPAGLAFDTETSRNQIQFTYGSKSDYDKYPLQFLNYSIRSGYEGLFYKFRVILTDSEKAAILNAVEQDNRVYKVSGIELSVNGNVVGYGNNDGKVQTYTYSGYALGYGSELATESTLSCTVDGLEKVLSLDVHSTYYRPTGTNGGFKSCTQDTLHSVYFSVPNEIIAEYGEMTAIHATWLNALTDIMLVTGNSTVYNHMLDYIGVDTGQNWNDTWNDDVNYSFITDYSPLTGETGDLEGGDIAYNPACALQGNSYNGLNGSYDGYNRLLTQLDYIFYADGGDADNYTLSSDKILSWLKKYTSIYGGELINDNYSAELFEKVDSEFTDITISAGDTFKLTSEEYTVEWYNKYLYTWFGAYSEVKTTTYNVNAIQKVTLSDMDNALNETVFCNSFYVAECDYDNLYNYVKTAKVNDETVYLFRYYQSDYWSAEVTECEPTLYLGVSPVHKQLDTNAYFAQEWIQLDFDIIDLTFTKDGASTVIPVVMSPIDIVPDVTPPVDTTPDLDTDGYPWWKLLIAVVLLIPIVIILSPIVTPLLSAVIRFVLWILTLPFKALGALIKAIFHKN